jgi:hypothetical protein
MIDAEVCTRPCKLCPFKMSDIICQDPLGYAKSVNYALQEFECCLMCDVYYWYSFHSLSEHVNCDEYKLELMP